ncbi:cytochrome domain of cellobiose dehydrogenase Hp3 Ph 7.5 [Leucogyrophana mollusca]|uniref:Cytochrome domain of cellobiose dehydrogenase Hp3 Ph 7.5 n=1 Tax=Leucogyrophana mollusca TaxID=85980 RepID=A0ACB8BN36_9AGAM|nr:cytochrome domain of cellobiose dehydrogenase Hp3 Ph 7.5 [Leucogyrophana mollusca]
MFLKYLVVSFIISGSVLGQSSSSYTDPDNGITFEGYTDPVHNVTYGLVFPPLSQKSTEFIGEIVATSDAKWIGLALSGSMLGDLLVVGWPNGNDIVSTTRFASTYGSPSPYAGPTVTNLASTTVNDTHWKWVFRCQNCTTWTNGSIPVSSEATLAWAYSNVAVAVPSDPNTSFKEHTDFGFFGENYADAHSDNYTSYL